MSALSACAGSADTDQDGTAYLSQVDEPALATSGEGALDGGVAPVLDPSRTAMPDAGPPPPPPNAIKLQDESGAEVAEIIASGRGCPLGSWDAQMAPDGLAFTATFTALSIAIDPAVERASANCLLTILPPGDATKQFSAQSLSYSGHVTLDEGVTGAMELRYSYQGVVASAPPGHAYEMGPADGTLTVSREVAEREARWTPCGPRRRGVTVDLLMRLSNTVPRASGTLQGEADSKLEIQLRSRDCPPTDAGVAR